MGLGFRGTVLGVPIIWIIVFTTLPTTSFNSSGFCLNVFSPGPSSEAFDPAHALVQCWAVGASVCMNHKGP